MENETKIRARTKGEQDFHRLERVHKLVDGPVERCEIVLISHLGSVLGDLAELFQIRRVTVENRKVRAGLSLVITSIWIRAAEEEKVDNRKVSSS